MVESTEQEGDAPGADRTVWVVDQGEYSDYHVIAVFDKEEHAKLLVDQMNQKADAEWRTGGCWETPLNMVPLIPKGLRVYRVTMQKSGDTNDTEDMTDDFSPRWFPNYVGPVTWYKREGFLSDESRDVSMVVLARDEVHAVKIVNEKRTQFLAENKWGVEKEEA